MKQSAGRFQLFGDCLDFFIGNELVPLQTLENLALERIVRVIGNSRAPNQLYWVVNNMVTEFHDDHHLMLRSATVVLSLCE